jgi:hypothetical protein
VALVLVVGCDKTCKSKILAGSVQREIEVCFTKSTRRTSLLKL